MNLKLAQGNCSGDTQNFSSIHLKSHNKVLGTNLTVLYATNNHLDKNWPQFIMIYPALIEGLIVLIVAKMNTLLHLECLCSST
jgi:hypothetical protein